MAKVVIDTPRMEAARQALLAAVTQTNRFAISIAIEELVHATMESAVFALVPLRFTDATETSTESAKAEKQARIAALEAKN